LILHIAHIPVNILFMKLIQVFTPITFSFHPQQGNRDPNILFDLFFFVYPTILSVTVLHEYVGILIVAFIISSGVIASYQYPRNKTNIFDQIDFTPSRVPILSLFKGANMLLTCISILAIDFQVLSCQSFHVLNSIRYSRVNLAKLNTMVSV
jgi:hypothetical protein